MRPVAATTRPLAASITMTDKHTIPHEELYDFDDDWPRAHGWAIDQMPCPAYCCTPDGAIVKFNASAERLWGWRPSPSAVGLWHGFDSLQGLNGTLIDQALNPAALASSSANASEVELIAICRNGQLRRIVARAKAIVGRDGASRGVLCCLIDVTEQWRWEREAREAVEGRTDFLTVLAHELRNPLSPIMSAAKILHGKNSDPTVVKMVEIVERQAKTLARFVSDLLDAARVNNLLQLNVEPRTCLVSEVLQRATDAVHHDMRSRKQSLAIDASDLGAALWCDPKRVAQAVGNVLANASKFTPDGGEIHLSLMIQGTSLQVKVIDQGPGISPAELEQLFVPFAQHAPAPGRAPSGASVGLALAKSACEAHHGTISASNAANGEGAIFTLSLPILAPDR